METLPNVIHSRSLAEDESGELLHFSREQVGWEWMSLTVKRLNPGDSHAASTNGEEAAFVLLGGRCKADWGEGEHVIGERKNVFDGLPYSVYLPTGCRVTFTAETVCEIAECRTPSAARLSPGLITPKDVTSSLRGGENEDPLVRVTALPAYREACRPTRRGTTFHLVLTPSLRGAGRQRR